MERNDSPEYRAPASMNVADELRRQTVAELRQRMSALTSERKRKAIMHAKRQAQWERTFDEWNQP
jgi:uncharacterized small protein (DUF1192 family)